jgi:5-methylcytosine-specific restriction endonuclease McrA
MTAHFKALVLNADFRPLSASPLEIWDWQDAVKAIHLDKAFAVAEYDKVVRSPSCEIRLPSVIALRQYQKVDGGVSFTRYNVFLRDRFHCQYCGVKRPFGGLTFDHVIPRCMGGETTWDNIVAACEPCNRAKADKLDMRPSVPPRMPTRGELIRAALDVPPGHLHETWIDFLYWGVDLER